MCVLKHAFLYGIGENHRLKALKKHYLENGVEPRVHKNTKRLPPCVATYNEIVALMTIMLKQMLFYYQGGYPVIRGMTSSYCLQILAKRYTKTIIRNQGITELFTHYSLQNIYFLVSIN